MISYRHVAFVAPAPDVVGVVFSSEALSFQEKFAAFVAVSPCCGHLSKEVSERYVCTERDELFTDRCFLRWPI